MDAVHALAGGGVTVPPKVVQPHSYRDCFGLILKVPTLIGASPEYCTYASYVPFGKIPPSTIVVTVSVVPPHSVSVKGLWAAAAKQLVELVGDTHPCGILDLTRPVVFV